MSTITVTEVNNGATRTDTNPDGDDTVTLEILQSLENTTGSIVPESNVRPPENSLATSAITPTESTIKLTLLLVSGARKIFDFTPNTTIAQVKRSAFEQWPEGEFHSWIFIR